MTNFADANRIGEAMPAELAGVAHHKAMLEDRGVPTDGRAVTMERRDDDMPSILRTERIWLLGNRVIGDLHSPDVEHDGKRWYRQIVDVDLDTGELNVFAESQKGTGGGTSNILTGEDFWPNIDGVRVRQLQSSMFRMWQNLLMEDGAKIE